MLSSRVLQLRKLKGETNSAHTIVDYEFASDDRQFKLVEVNLFVCFSSDRLTFWVASVIGTLLQQPLEQQQVNVVHS